MDFNYAIKSVLFGHATGDALGVPVEFRSRFDLSKQPVTDMTGYGTYHLPPGTWSDDGSMTFCLAEALTHGFDLETIAGNFVRWYSENYWTPLGSVFDIGIATREAIYRLMQGTQPQLAGGMSVSSNGNGSLMRIAPLLFYLHDKPIEERYELTRLVSSITHRHLRSVIACFIYLEFGRELLHGKNFREAYAVVRTTVRDFLRTCEKPEENEVALFHRVLESDISDREEHEISGSGYVLHTLEAALWCLLTTGNYADAVLKAVNLGEDTDTTAAVTGAWAGLFYGFDAIPPDWIGQLARKNDIADLAQRLSNRLSN